MPHEPNVANIQAVEAAKAIAALREKLLDLSNRNRLLNFPHSPRSRGHVRLIDEIPALLFSELSKGADFGFKALPEPEDDEGGPEDENTPEFEAALEQAQTENQEYQQRKAKIEKQFDSDEDDEGYGRAMAKLDRWLRDRVRDDLGLDPVEQQPNDPFVVARENGIEPSYDLPETPREKAKPEQCDRWMQTLLFPDELERKLNGVHETAVHALNEKGVNTLYVAFGFLEWFESDDSDKPLFAPLVLVPAQIEKRLEQGHIDFVLRALDEEPQFNITLAARLKQDFHLVLPELEEDEEPDQYLRRVSHAIQGRKRWRVRRFVTIGHFAFARLVMYNDLNEEKWPEGKKPRTHIVVRRMFGGSEGRGGSGFREVYNPDDHVHEMTAPPLVVDADSSQFSAVVDVLAGHNLVIQGPPGTGKSQTITNIIAAAVDKGQSVLFVAEKMAALNVVMSRLQSCGLSPFCLELHSTKANKQAVLAALRERTDVRAPYYNSAKAHVAMKELRDAKEKLRQYLAILATDLGQTQLRISQVLWLTHQKPEDQLPEALRALSISDVETWNPTKQQRIRQYLNDLTDTEVGLGAPPETCAWNWLVSPSITPVDFPAIVTAVERSLELVGRIKQLHSSLSNVTGINAADSVQTIRPFLSLLERLPAPTSPEDEKVFDALSDPQAAQLVARLRTLNAELASTRGRLGVWFPSAFRPTLVTRDELGRVAQDLGRTHAGQTLSEAYSDAKKHDDFADDVERLLRLLDQVIRLIRATHVERNANTVEIVAELLVLVRDSKPQVIADRMRARVDPNASIQLEELVAQKHTLGQQADRLRQRLRCDPRNAAADVLRLHRTSLQRRGMLGWLFSDYRAGLRFARAFYEEGKAPSKEEMCVDLSALESFATQRDSYFGGEKFVAFVGTIDQGFETDFGRLKTIVDWAERVRRIFREETTLCGAIRDFLLTAPVPEIEQLGTLLDGNAEALLNRLGDDQRTVLDQMSTAPTSLRAEAARIRGLLAVTDGLGVERTQGVDQLAQITQTCSKWLETDSVLTQVSSEIELRFVVPGVVERTDAIVPMRSVIEKSALPAATRARFLAQGGIAVLHEAKRHAADLSETLGELMTEAKALAGRAGMNGLPWHATSFGSLSSALEVASANESSLPHWCSWLRVCDALETEHTGDILDQVRAGIPAATVSTHFDHILYRAMARRAHELHPALRRFTGVTLTEAQERVRKIDAKLKEYAREEVISHTFAAGGRAPDGNGLGPVKTYTEMALVYQELGKKKRHIPLRDLLARAGTAIQCLKPCFMMSPMSVAQFLKNDGLKFDIVIFDEASQVLPEDSLGAVLRGERLIVVGDQMQLPPTDFFQRTEVEAAEDLDEEDAAAIHGLESILDKALSVFQPARRLLWHYRSRDPQLIAYSNREFYDDALQLFPAAHSKHDKFGIKVVDVGGTYVGRCNAKEAQVMAEAAVAFMHRYPNRSLGLVALNGQQRDLIQDKVDRLIAEDSKAADYCRSYNTGLEPFFVKNLENVQGDERDVIFISTVFGPDAKGSVYQRFGPINSAVGHRRLNVLFTRAKEAVVVFTSLRTEDILIEENSSRGRQVLRGYLEYARSGILDGGSRTGREPDSEFEEMVRDRLRREGYEVDCQVGISGYFVDLAVRNPKRPASYILAVECDGATYHSFKSARDRDRLRQEILERLGWKIHRIWSTDWFQNPEREMRKVLERLKVEEQSASGDGETHLDYSVFASRADTLPKPPKRARTKATVQTNLSFGSGGQNGTGAPNLSPDDIARFLVVIRQRATPQVLAAFERSLDFGKGTPIAVVIESTRVGVHRRLEIEEAYNREAFRWAERSQALFRMPWATNLSAQENFELREFALSMLFRCGKLKSS